uniref:AP complex mu/sigma subunit domain-containing protein n=1 Tax=Ailuropoda melanoleuca TaxID=9646 RepID=A0A7N5JGD4_AILME
MHRWVGGTLSPAPDWPPASARSALHHPVVIRATLIFNNHGKQWLSAYYLPDCEDPQQQTIRETFHLVPKKDETVNLLEGGCDFMFTSYLSISQYLFTYLFI